MAAAASSDACQGGGEGGDGAEGEGRAPFVLGDVEHVLCHSPYNKLVQKSFARMVFADAKRLKAAGKPLGEGEEEALGRWLDVPAEVKCRFRFWFWVRRLFVCVLQEGGKLTSPVCACAWCVVRRVRVCFVVSCGWCA